MKHSILWLSLSACIRVIARPVSYSNYILTDTNTDYVSTDASTWPSNTNDPLDSPSQHNSFTVAEQPEPQKPSPPSLTVRRTIAVPERFDFHKSLLVSKLTF